MWVTHMSVILNGLLWHVEFAEVGEEVIADDRVDCLKTFAGLVLGGSGWGHCLSSFLWVFFCGFPLFSRSEASGT